MYMLYNIKDNRIYTVYGICSIVQGPCCYITCTLYNVYRLYVEKAYILMQGSICIYIIIYVYVCI